MVVFPLGLISLVGNSAGLASLFLQVRQVSADLSAFNAEVGGWLTTLPVIDFPPLSGIDLYETVQAKTPTSSSLDGWGWKEMQSHSVAWFACLAVILDRTEHAGDLPRVCLTLLSLCELRLIVSSR